MRGRGGRIFSQSSTISKGGRGSSSSSTPSPSVSMPKPVIPQQKVIRTIEVVEDTAEKEAPVESIVLHAEKEEQDFTPSSDFETTPKESSLSTSTSSLLFPSPAYKFLPS